MNDPGLEVAQEHSELWSLDQGDDMASKQPDAPEERKWWRDYFRLRVWVVVAIVLPGAKPVWPFQYIGFFAALALILWLPRGNVALRGGAIFLLPVASFFIYPRGDDAQGTLWVVRWVLPVIVVVELVYWIVLSLRLIRQ
jgi:hypothetical protein